jgi:hypothetical protein
MPSFFLTNPLSRHPPTECHVNRCQPTQPNACRVRSLERAGRDVRVHARLLASVLVRLDGSGSGLDRPGSSDLRRVECPQRSLVWHAHGSHAHEAWPVHPVDQGLCPSFLRLVHLRLLPSRELEQVRRRRGSPAPAVRLVPRVATLLRHLLHDMLPGMHRLVPADHDRRAGTH